MDTKERRDLKSSKKQMVATSLRVESDLLTAIDDYGHEIERSRNWVVNKLLSRQLDSMGLV